MWCIASDTYSRTDERSTARSSPPRENGVVPEPFSCSPSAAARERNRRASPRGRRRSRCCGRTGRARHRLAEDRDGVRRRPRAAAARRRPAREERHELGVGRRGRVEAERREHVRARAHQERVRQRLGLDVDPEAERLARLAVRVRGVAVRVGRQCLLDRVVAALEKRAHRRRRRTAAHHPSTRADGAENCAGTRTPEHAARCACWPAWTNLQSTATQLRAPG